MTLTAQVLLVCGDSTAKDLTPRLDRLGCTVCAALPSRSGMVALPEDLRPDLALIDIEQDAGAIEAAGRIRSRFDVPVVYMVGVVDETLLSRARKTEPFGYVAKPLGDNRQLRISIDAALSQAAARRRERESRNEARQRLLELQRRVAVMDAAVNGMSEGVVVTDLDGRILLINRAVKEILGVDDKAQNLSQAREAYHFFKSDGETPLPVAESPLGLALRGTRSDEVEVVARCPQQGTDDADIHLCLSGRPFRDAGGRSLGWIGIVRDVTREKNAQAERNRVLSDAGQQAELMERVLDSMNDAIAVFDPSGKCVLLNQQGRRLVGVDPQQLDVSLIFDTLSVQISHADGSPCPRNELPAARVLRGESFDNLQLLAETSVSSDRIRVTAAGRPLLDPDGTGRGGVVVFRDVTEKRRREEQLQEVTETLRAQKQVTKTILDSVSDGVVVTDARGGLTISNSSAERIVGTGMIDSNPDDWSAASAAYGVFLSDRTTPFPPDQLPLARALRGESSDVVELFVRNQEKPGGTFVGVSGRPLRCANQTIAGAVVVFCDTTQIKSAKEELQRVNDDLRQQNQFMEMIFESISDGVVVADARGRLTLANASAKRMVGMNLTAAPSEDWSTLYGTFHPDEVTPFPSGQLPLVRAVNGESSSNVEFFIRNPHMLAGMHISASGRPMRKQGGASSGGVIVFHDITQRVHAQAALLRAFDRGRLEVIETVLHNIGNATNSVATGVETIFQRSRNNTLVDRFVALANAVGMHQKDWIDWLSSDPQGQKVRVFLLALVKDLVTWNESLRDTAERMVSQMQRIVDIIRTQEGTGRSTEEHKSVDLSQVTAAAVRVLDVALAKRGLTVDVDCTRAPDEIHVQENKLNQVLVNLLWNAVEAIDDRARTSGAIRLDAEADWRIRVCAYVREELLAIDVIDNGIGIAPAHVRDIFRAGYTTKARGSGLGLHSAAIFVTAAGGRIEALSEGIDRGATMRVTLPLVGLRQESLP